MTQEKVFIRNNNFHWRLKDRYVIVVIRYETNNDRDCIFRTEYHSRYHRKSIPHDFRREYRYGYFSRLYTFLLRKTMAFLRQEFLQEFKLCSISSKIFSWPLSLTIRWVIYTGVWFHSNVKFNRNFKLIGTSSRKDRSLFWQLPMMLTQSRITSRPSVKVFNGLSPYRRAIFVRERARARTGEKVNAGIRGGGRRNGGAEPLFFYFGLSTSPEKIASLKRIRLGFHNGRVPNPVYPPTTIPAFLPHFHPHPPNVSAAFGMYGESVVLTLGALINF